MPAGVRISDADARQASQSVSGVSIWVARSPFRQTKSGFSFGALRISRRKTESREWMSLTTQKSTFSCAGSSVVTV